MMKQKPMSLLLIQGNTEDTGLQAVLLKDRHKAFNLIHVTRLSEAVEHLKEGSFDLVLLDLAMPDASGLETIGRLKDCAGTAPIVALTGLNDEKAGMEAMSAGAQDYLIKNRIDGTLLTRLLRHAIDRKRTETQLQHQRARQAVLHQINLAITSTLDLQSVLEILLQKVNDAFPRFATTIRLIDLKNGDLGTTACRNVDEGAWKKIAPSPAAGLAKAVFEARKPLAIADIINDARVQRPDFIRSNGFVSYLGIPLIIQDQILGALNLYTREKHEFSNEEVEFFNTLGAQAAMAIHNSQLYEQIKTANNALEKTLEVKSALVGVMAHELKTPIQVIIGTANMLSAGMCGKLTEEQEARVHKIETSADELLQLIDAALDMAQPKRERISVRGETVDVGTLLRDLASEFAEPFAKKGVELEMREPSERILIETDRLRVKEILRNLIENARKYTAKGKVEVAAREYGDGRIEFCVKDTGEGIKAELLPKIFELFYRIEPAIENDRSGAGLGLNIVKRLLELLSGEIQVESEVGKGTCFRVFLPRQLGPSQSGAAFVEP
jgi:signal transduction histidine kinase/DNA-binding response OmpR family regulator